MIPAANPAPHPASAAGTAPAEAAPGQIPPVGRFTQDGDDALENDLARSCGRVLSGLRGLIPRWRLDAVLLGGGYGRGEGGVCRTAEGDRPYNDLEFYVVIRGHRHLNERRYHRRLEALAKILTHLAGIEVEFKITSLAALARQPVSMFSYDLVAGHRLLWGLPLGETSQLDHHLRAEHIPAAEATRLLMNRGSGLLFARAALTGEPLTPGAADFIRRNVAKAELACGDAVLAARGQYHWSCEERHRRLRQLAEREASTWLAAVVRHHAAGVEFKLHPESEALGRAELSDRLAAITLLTRRCWLWLESRRLGRSFSSVRAYSELPVDKCPGSSPWRNLLMNLRISGLGRRRGPRPWRHPRQRIFHALVLLLWDPAATTHPRLRQRIGEELGVVPGTCHDWIPAYRALWRRVQ